MKRRSWIARFSGAMAALAVGATAVMTAPSAAAAGVVPDLGPVTDAPVEVVSELDPGTEGYIVLQSREYGATHSRYWFLRYFYELPAEMTFVESAPIYYRKLQSGGTFSDWFVPHSHEFQDSRTLAASWSGSYGDIGRAPAQMLVKVKMSDSAKDSSILTVMLREYSARVAAIDEPEHPGYVLREQSYEPVGLIGVAYPVPAVDPVVGAAAGTGVLALLGAGFFLRRRKVASAA